MGLLNKKGQGISINVIIIAAIALLVLVILAVLVLRAGGDLNDKKCNPSGGVCRDSCDYDVEPIDAADCPYDKECCPLITIGDE